MMAQADSESIGGPEATFLMHLEAGRIMIQKHATSGAHVFLPRVYLPGHSDQSLEWVESSGTGIIYACTVIAAGRGREEPYCIALVDLEEGVRMMTRIVDVSPDRVHIGMRVEGYCGTLNGSPAVLFRPAGGAHV